MKRIKLLFTTVLLLSLCGGTQAQFTKRLGTAIENAAKNAAVRKAEQKTEEAVSKGIDKATDPNSYKGEGTNHNTGKSSSGGNNEKASGGGNESASGGKAGAGPQQGGKAIETAYVKSDFVPGDEIIFDDPMTSEKMGEFPSQWDLIEGNAEVANIGGHICLYMEAPNTAIAPLMKNMKSYLPDVFTVEFDYWVNNFTETNNPPSQNYRLHFYSANNSDIMELEFAEGAVKWNYTTPEGERREGRLNMKEKIDSWSHFSVSFNKRAFKAYVNGVRVVNLPSMAVPVRLNLNNTSWNNHRCAITNFRIAKGAVPLYDRLASEGKIISYGITFDVGKSTIKPESMTEINRIAQLMKDNPDLKFSVEGHTDNTGSAASNQTLSEARSKAVLDKLVEMGISSSRLKSAGKGQTSPIADNSTDEGRAKNRRVEFVKI